MLVIPKIAHWSQNKKKYLMKLWMKKVIQRRLSAPFIFFMIKFHKHKKEYKALKSTTNLRFIDLKFIDIRFIDST